MPTVGNVQLMPTLIKVGQERAEYIGVATLQLVDFRVSFVLNPESA